MAIGIWAMFHPSTFTNINKYKNKWWQSKGDNLNKLKMIDFQYELKDIKHFSEISWNLFWWQCYCWMPEMFKSKVYDYKCFNRKRNVSPLNHLMEFHENSSKILILSRMSNANFIYTANPDYKKAVWIPISLFHTVYISYIAEVPVNLRWPW